MRITLVQALATLLLGGVTLARPVRAQDLLDQKITLQVNNERLRSVLTRLETTARVSFMYQSKVLADNPRLTLSVTARPLGEVLDELLLPRQLRYEIIGRQIVLSRRPPSPAEATTGPPMALAEPAVPQARLSGVVSDESSAPLPGVNVRVKNATYGTTTNAAGEYSLTVPDEVARGGTLVFSSVGYNAQEVAIGSRTTINVTLVVNIQSLGEVVVVGYGTQKQREVTGAVASVGSKDINQVAVTGLDQALQGRMAGVQVTQNSGEPGGSVSVRIRGVGSITSGSEPLYVVDGIPLTGGLNAINPNDIERIDVLKDAASAAIYGSRGTNGVVLVTTKRGKSGKITVSLDAYAGVQSAAKKLNLLNGPEFARLANDNLRNAGLPTNPAWDAPNQPTYDWQDAVLQKSPMQNYNVSLSGGGERSRTFFSAGFFQQGGIIIGSDYRRYTARLNTDYDLSSRLKVGATFNVAHSLKNAVSTESGFSGVLTNVAQLQPTSPIYSSQDGVINDTFYGWQGYNFISKTAPIGFYPSGLNNEVHTNKEYFKRPQTDLQLLAAVFGEYEVLKGLKLRSTLNVTLGNSFGSNSQLRSPDAITSVGQYRNLSGYSENWGRSDQWNWINTAAYARTIGRHSFSVIAGIDALKNNFRGVNVSTVGNPPDQLSINASQATGRVATGAPSDFALVSYFGRVTYDFAGKYLATINFRRDGSSKFGPNYKYGNFPSASVGWRLTEEPFMKSLTVFDELKLRASYGVVGNQNIGNFLYLNTYTADGGTFQYVLGKDQTPVPALYANNIGDPNIRWERSVQTNLGFDASLLRGRFTLTADYFIKDLQDLLGFVPIPNYTGVYGGFVFRNGFSMQNRGLELALGFNQQFGPVKFSANANFTALDNKITQLSGSDKSYVATSISVGGGRDDNAQTRTQVGERIANFWGYVTDGIFQNQAEIDASAQKGTGVKPGDRRYKDLNGDGKFNSDDKTILGNGLPRYTFGLNLRAQFKGFDLTAFFTGQAKAQIANMTKFFLYNMRFYNTTGLTNGSRDLLDSWSPTNPSQTMPRNSYDVPASNRYFSSYYIEDGSFLRLRNLQLGYTLPTGFGKGLGLSNARVYVAAQNLVTFTKYSGYDPEVGSANVNGGTNQSPLTTGTDYGRYPVARIFMGGINFQF
jgi:TonB-linked SusC/RagA family outer membrane protein